MNPDLSQLRDIHLPAPISWWPPAPGWWLLAGMVVALMLGLYALIRRYRRNDWRRVALRELTRLREQHESQQHAPHNIVSGLSVLLRRVAISRFPREEVAVLNGDAWLGFLDSSVSGETSFQSGLGRLLTVAPYTPKAVIAPDALLKLFVMSEKWMNKLPARGRA